MEGGKATFSCNATLNGANRLLNYRIRSGAGALLQSVRLNITDLSTVNGVVGACVLGEFNSQLVLKGVTREANGYTVACSILNEDGLTFADQTQPPATISVKWPPVLSSEGRNISLLAGESYPRFNFTVDDEGNPPSTMTITGPSQPDNPRVSISSEGVVSINGVSVDDNGTHIATWRNDAGSATFTLDLNVTSAAAPARTEEIVCGIECIIGSVVGSIAFILLVIVLAVVLLVCCICCECCICYIWCNKCRQKRSEDEEEDKGVSLT